MNLACTHVILLPSIAGLTWSAEEVDLTTLIVLKWLVWVVAADAAPQKINATPNVINKINILLFIFFAPNKFPNLF